MLEVECDWMHNILIGILSGLISGALINALWSRFDQKKLREKERIQWQEANRQKYEMMVQQYCRYVDDIIFEFDQCEDTGYNDISALLRTIADEPILIEFSEMYNEEGEELLNAIREGIDQLLSFSEGSSHSHERYVSLRATLTRAELDFLKRKNEIYVQAQ